MGQVGAVAGQSGGVVDNALMRIKRKVTAATSEGVEWPFVNGA